MPAENNTPAKSAAPRTGKLYRWYVLTVLFLIYVLACIDRQILAVMVAPIQTDHALTDTRMSLLLGLAFVSVYVLFSLPMARVADHHKRRSVIAFGLGLWSISTALFALSSRYWQLFVSRMGVGLGEACLNPAALPLLSDAFPRQSLGKAIGCYMLAVPIGNGLAGMIGGGLMEQLTAGSSLTLPLAGTLQPWQLVLLVLCLTGLLLLLLLFTVREPARNTITPAIGTAQYTSLPFKDVSVFLRAHHRVFVSLALPLVASALMFFGVGYWVPTYFMRSADTFGLEGGDLVFWWGVINMGAGATGVLSGGFLADYLSSRFRDGLWRTLMIGTVLLGAGFSLFPLAAGSAGALGLLIPGILGNGFLQAAGITTIMTITPDPIRGQVSALYFFLVNLVGAGLGPTLITLLSGLPLFSSNPLGLAMAFVALVSCVTAWLMLWKNRPDYCRLLEQMEHSKT